VFSQLINKDPIVSLAILSFCLRWQTIYILCVKRKTGGEEKYLAAGTVVADEKVKSYIYLMVTSTDLIFAELNLHTHTHTRAS